MKNIALLTHKFRDIATLFDVKCRTKKGKLFSGLWMKNFNYLPYYNNLGRFL